MFNVFVVVIALTHVRFLEEMLPIFPLTFLKLIFNIFINFFLLFYVAPEFPPILYGFGFV